jgi:hypothetical protein
VVLPPRVDGYCGGRGCCANGRSDHRTDVGCADPADLRHDCCDSPEHCEGCVKGIGVVQRCCRGVVETCVDGGQWCGGGVGGWAREGAKATLVTAMRRKGRHGRAFARRRGVAVVRARNHILSDHHRVHCVPVATPPAYPISVVMLFIMLCAPAPSLPCNERNPQHSHRLSAACDTSAPQDAAPTPTAYKRLKKYT